MESASAHRPLEIRVFFLTRGNKWLNGRFTDLSKDEGSTPVHILLRLF
jgi:hypothetical protein